MNPIEIFKTIRELLDLDKNTIAALISGMIVGVAATYWYYRRRNSVGLLEIIKVLRQEKTELENELLKAFSEVGRLREENRRLLGKTGQPPQPPSSDKALSPETQIVYAGKTITRDNVVAAMKAIDDTGGPKWTKNHKWQVPHNGRYYPPKDVLGKVSQAERLADFNTADAVWVLGQLGFEIVPKPMPDKER